MSQHIPGPSQRTAAAWAWAGALIVFASAAAQAQLGIYGGGASLPAIANRNLMNCYGDNSAGNPPELGTPPSSTTNPPGVFDCTVAPYPLNPAVEFLYLSVGSGNGKRAWREHNPASLTFGSRVPDASPTGASGDLGCFYDTNCANTSWDRGFVGQTADAVAYPTLHYAGTDDPLVSSDVSAYETTSGANHDFGPPKQAPIAVATVGLALNPAPSWNPKGKVFGAHNSKVMLSRDTWCGIMTGAITTWSDSEITDDNASAGVGGTTPLGTGSIVVVYRGDSSGTTSLFSNALVNQCGSTSHPVAGSAHPVPDAWLADQSPAIPNSAPFAANRDDFFIRVAAAGHLPANFLAATGNGGVKAAILAGAGRIGYLTPNAFQPYDTTGPKVANLQIWDNVLDLDQGLTTLYKYAEPSPKKGTAIMASLKPPSFSSSTCATAPGGCFNDVLKWAPANPLPLSSSAYPIGGFTMALLYTCYADQDVVDALTTPFGSATPAGYLPWLTGTATQNGNVPNYVLAQKGLAAIPSAWEGAVRKLLLTDARTKIRKAPDTDFPAASRVCPLGTGA